jgi:hypothetical protein
MSGSEEVATRMLPATTGLDTIPCTTRDETAPDSVTAMMVDWEELLLRVVPGWKIT